MNLTKTEMNGRVGTGELRLASIGHNSDTGNALITGAVGNQNFTAEIPPRALQSYPAFQAAVFSACGLWPRCWQVEECCRGREALETWQNYIAAVMGSGEDGE